MFGSRFISFGEWRMAAEKKPKSKTPKHIINVLENANELISLFVYIESEKSVDTSAFINRKKDKERTRESKSKSNKSSV